MGNNVFIFPCVVTVGDAAGVCGRRRTAAAAHGKRAGNGERPGGYGILVEYIVGPVYTFTLIFYFCKLFKVRFIYTSRFSHIN